jgi:hypothetical protein
MRFSGQGEAMPTFIQAGRHWINLDQVTRIDVKEDPSRPGAVVTVDVLFSSGQKDQFGGQEGQAVSDFLKSHKAT